MYINLKPKKALSITEIVFAEIYDFGKNSTALQELSRFWILVYVKDGEAKAKFNDNLINASKDQLIIVPPGKLYKIRFDWRRADIFCIAFSCGCKRLNDVVGRHYCSDEQKSAISYILNNADTVLGGSLSSTTSGGTDEYSSFDAAFGTEQIIKECLELLLIDIINHPCQTTPKSRTNHTHALPSEEKLYKNICDYLMENIDSNLSVNDICRKFYISSSSIKKLFSSHSGGGVIKFFHRLKIEKAKEYIAHGNMNFTEISEALGFSSLHYFSRYFKIITGLSPTDYMVSLSKL
ncbi:MAG TPA: AraC family transcriptional regulator [Firmicutes bacterium]|nr:AraC family transcriptional regulator [Bacillota bacterium]